MFTFTWIHVEKIIDDFERKQQNLHLRLAAWLNENRELRSIEKIENLYPAIFGVFDCKKCKEFEKKYRERTKIKEETEWYTP